MYRWFQSFFSRVHPVPLTSSQAHAPRCIQSSVCAKPSPLIFFIPPPTHDWNPCCTLLNPWYYALGLSLSQWTKSFWFIEKYTIIIISRSRKSRCFCCVAVYIWEELNITNVCDPVVIASGQRHNTNMFAVNQHHQRPDGNVCLVLKAWQKIGVTFDSH